MWGTAPPKTLVRVSPNPLLSLRVRVSPNPLLRLRVRVRVRVRFGCVLEELRRRPHPPSAVIRVVADPWVRALRVLEANMPEGVHIWLANIKHSLVPFLERALQLLGGLA